MTAPPFLLSICCPLCGIIYIDSFWKIGRSLSSARDFEVPTMENKPLMRVYEEDEIIMREGESYGEMYKIISGSAALYLDYGGADEYLIGVISAGKCFGEVSLLAGRPEQYTVVAVDRVMVMAIREEQFEGFIKDNLHNTIDIMKNMADRIVMLNKNLGLIADELYESYKDGENKNSVTGHSDISEKIKMYRIMCLTGQNDFLGKV